MGHPPRGGGGTRQSSHGCGQWARETCNPCHRISRAPGAPSLGQGPWPTVALWHGRSRAARPPGGRGWGENVIGEPKRNAGDDGLEDRRPAIRNNSNNTAFLCIHATGHGPWQLGHLALPGPWAAWATVAVGVAVLPVACCLTIMISEFMIMMMNH